MDILLLVYDKDGKNEYYINIQDSDVVLYHKLSKTGLRVTCKDKKFLSSLECDGSNDKLLAVVSVCVAIFNTHMKEAYHIDTNSIQRVFLLHNKVEYHIDIT